MKKYLGLLIISLLVFSACSTDQELNEVAEELPVKEDTEMEEDIVIEEEKDTADTEKVMEETEEAMGEEVVEEVAETSGLLEITLEELKQYNGKDGNPAYIAIDGKVYDVTDIPNWSGGSHNGFKAGLDLTEEMKEISPHGVSKLEFVQEVGIIVE